MKFDIRQLEFADIPSISKAFNHIGWNKPASLFSRYFKEQEAGARLAWVAYLRGHPLVKGAQYIPYAGTSRSAGMTMIWCCGLRRDYHKNWLT